MNDQNQRFQVSDSPFIATFVDPGSCYGEAKNDSHMLWRYANESNEDFVRRHLQEVLKDSVHGTEFRIEISACDVDTGREVTGLVPTINLVVPLRTGCDSVLTNDDLIEFFMGLESIERLFAELKARNLDLFQTKTVSVINRQQRNS